jgi:magnesium-protoporphyrin IX monomethyl ester (oxidative) cyclase
MMHIPDRRRGLCNHPPELPMGIASLAAFLEPERIPVQCLDLAVCQDPAKALVQKLKAYQPRYVGITALSSIMPGVEIVADLCREEMGGDVVLIAGGEHPSFMKERMLFDYPVFDYVVYGEGEETLTELVQRLDAGELVDDVEGLVYRRGEEVLVNGPRPLIEDFDSLPFPARHLLPVERYIPWRHRGDYFRLPSASIMVSRGSPHDLNLCSKAVWGGTSRFRSARRILEEMKQCIKKYGIREFRFFDDNLTVPNGPISELCDLIVNKGLDVTWSCYSRVMGIKKHILAKMKEAGCYRIHYGIEVGTEKALKIANLNTTLEQAGKAVDWTKELGIESTCHFLLGLPGETWEDCEATVNFALELNPDRGSFEIFEVTPGSSLYEEFPFAGEEESAPARIPAARLEKLATRARFKFYFRLAWFMRTLRRLNRNSKREISGNWAAVRWLFRKLLWGLRIRLPWNWETRNAEEALPDEQHAMEPSLEPGAADRHDSDKTPAPGGKGRPEVIEVDRR